MQQVLVHSVGKLSLRQLKCQLSQAFGSLESYFSHFSVGLSVHACRCTCWIPHFWYFASQHQQSLVLAVAALVWSSSWNLVHDHHLFFSAQSTFLNYLLLVLIGHRPHHLFLHHLRQHTIWVLPVLANWLFSFFLLLFLCGFWLSGIIVCFVKYCINHIFMLLETVPTCPRLFVPPWWLSFLSSFFWWLFTSKCWGGELKRPTNHCLPNLLVLKRWSLALGYFCTSDSIFL